jgi:hypothetical protein
MKAEIIVMTTEILRNMAYRVQIEDDPGGGLATQLCDVGLVILDEVHYLGNPDRGSVWEEIVINLPEHVQVLAMSATVANPEEIGGWIEHVHGSCKTIQTSFRPVPLQWLFAWDDGLSMKLGNSYLAPLLDDTMGDKALASCQQVAPRRPPSPGRTYSGGLQDGKALLNKVMVTGPLLTEAGSGGRGLDLSSTLHSQVRQRHRQGGSNAVATNGHFDRAVNGSGLGDSNSGVEGVGFGRVLESASDQRQTGPMLGKTDIKASTKLEPASETEKAETVDDDVELAVMDATTSDPATKSWAGSGGLGPGLSSRQDLRALGSPDQASSRKPACGLTSASPSTAEDYFSEDEGSAPLQPHAATSVRSGGTNHGRTRAASGGLAEHYSSSSVVAADRNGKPGVQRVRLNPMLRPPDQTPLRKAVQKLRALQWKTLPHEPHDSPAAIRLLQQQARVKHLQVRCSLASFLFFKHFKFQFISCFWCRTDTLSLCG